MPLAFGAGRFMVPNEYAGASLHTVDLMLYAAGPGERCFFISARDRLRPSQLHPPTFPLQRLWPVLSKPREKIHIVDCENIGHDPDR